MDGGEASGSCKSDIGVNICSLTIEKPTVMADLIFRNGGHLRYVSCRPKSFSSTFESGEEHAFSDLYYGDVFSGVQRLRVWSQHVCTGIWGHYIRLWMTFHRRWTLMLPLSSFPQSFSFLHSFYWFVLSFAICNLSTPFLRYWSLYFSKILTFEFRA